MQTAVIGVGNPWRRDDGIGPKVIKQLATRNCNATLIDAGTDGLALLDILPKYHTAIIIDAVTMGLAPGTIKIFDPTSASFTCPHTTSTHGLGLATLLKLAQTLELKTHIIIIGIEPATISFGNSLSPILTDKIATLTNQVLQLLKELA